MKPALIALVLVGAFIPIASPARVPGPDAARKGPAAIMFHGGVLEGRRYITDFDEITCFLFAMRTPVVHPRDAIADRPYIEVAMFWHDPTRDPRLADTMFLNSIPLPSKPWRQSQPPALSGNGRDPYPDKALAQLIQPARLYLGKGDLPTHFDSDLLSDGPVLASIAPEGLLVLARHSVPLRSDRPNDDDALAAAAAASHTRASTCRI